MEQEKASPAKKPIQPPKSGKEEKIERKLRFRNLTDEILEKCRRMSEDLELYRRQYGEAVFKVYGASTSRKNSFQAAAKKEGKQKG